ncbi:hypothetical protein VIN01S_31630 [Vibrio inusitatus NBRC 102082]|uniref:Uncharacterized protein n=1 Tax=Vibrio inusitatus NBRC 102082 TaxID=1219070 RepID=A0A4Y3HYU4_9VIBR|nr:hypothetical protein VIN01S_31630 [Vibrio inusitatus NBRC 102082]
MRIIQSEPLMEKILKITNPNTHQRKRTIVDTNGMFDSKNGVKRNIKNNNEHPIPATEIHFLIRVLESLYAAKEVTRYAKLAPTDDISTNQNKAFLPKKGTIIEIKDTKIITSLKPHLLVKWLGTIAAVKRVEVIKKPFKPDSTAPNIAKPTMIRATGPMRLYTASPVAHA